MVLGQTIGGDGVGICGIGDAMFGIIWPVPVFHYRIVRCLWVKIAVLMLRVPPDVFLALRPGPSLRIGGGTIVEDASIGGPGKAPIKADVIVGIAMLRPVIAPLGHDAAEDPAATRGTAIALQCCKILDYFTIGQRIAVDLLNNIVNHGFAQWVCAQIVPG